MILCLTMQTLAALQEVREIVEWLLRRVWSPLSSVLVGTDDGRMYDCCLDQQGQSFLLEATGPLIRIVLRLDEEGGWWHDGSGLLQLGRDVRRALFVAVIEIPASKQLWEVTVMSEVQELMVSLHDGQG